MKIAVLGMGRLGQALAGRLLRAGHDLSLWNRSPGKAAALVERGASEAPSPAAAVDGADLAVTVLADDDAVRDVALGRDGVRSALAQQATYVDCSTVSPGLTRQLHADMNRYVAMPILGSPMQVAAGGATYLIGADRRAAQAVEPLFPMLSEKTLRYDEPWTAAAAKVSVNLLLLNGVVALAESFAVGRAGGLSNDQLRQLLGDSPMVAPGLRYRFEGILTGDQETFWTTVLGTKDANLAVELAASAGVDLPATTLARDLYQQASERFAHEDIAQVADRYRRQPSR